MALCNKSQEIDRLFELYLNLVHQYDVLRKSLNELHSTTQYNIARANFKAARGMRYGEELYDARMQATKRCHLTLQRENDTAAFTVSILDTQVVLPCSQDDGYVGIPNETADGEPQESISKEKCNGGNKSENSPSRNPMNMFGILVPKELRLAQEASIKIVQDIIPYILTLDAEMKQLEIKIRRERKQRIKITAKDNRTSTITNQQKRVSEAELLL
ncbi:hypothetical protein K3495_g8774 [Podosphaera aphanis]|nr:hypothetical protein K3495_g8774 [Podosphaera aphanis]